MYLAFSLAQTLFRPLSKKESCGQCWLCHVFFAFKAARSCATQARARNSPKAGTGLSTQIQILGKNHVHFCLCHAPPGPALCARRQRHGPASALAGQERSFAPFGKSPMGRWRCFAPRLCLSASCAVLARLQRGICGFLHRCHFAAFLQAYSFLGRTAWLTAILGFVCGLVQLHLRPYSCPCDAFAAHAALV